MKLTKKEIQEVIKKFDLSTKSTQISVLQSGHINDTFKIKSNSESYILQKINTQIFQNVEAIMENMQTVSAHLKNKGYPLEILSAIPLKTGDLFYKKNEKESWRMMPFFQNTITIEKVENQEQAHVAAQTFGNFLAYLSDLEASKINVIIPKFHDALFRINQFKNALKNASLERLNLAKKEIAYIEKELNFLEEIASIKLPLRITHNDTKISNILFKEDKKTPVAVIDWDTIMPGNILNDFGDCVRTFSTNCEEDEGDVSKIKFRKDYYEVIKDGFLSSVSSFVKEEEVAHLDNGVKRVILVQAIRFLSDFLTNDVYYKTKSPLHNLDRTRNQLELYRQMQDGVKAPL